MLEDKYQLTQLFDFYGELLTDKQKQIMHFYLEADLTLAEIAENLEVSRQAVYDHVQKSGGLLAHYEQKLGLLERFHKREALLLKLKRNVEELPCDLKQKQELITQLETIIDF